MISVLIPWRDDGADRGRIFAWIRERYRRLLPDAQLCLGDSGHEPFNRGASVNLAAQHAAHDLLLVADADTAFDPDVILLAGAMATLQDTWVLPYGTYVNLDEASTARLLARRPDVRIRDEEMTADFRLKDSVSGLVVMTRAGFERVGGFDESFRSWGYEDRAFESAANTLIGPCRRLPEESCFHLWHEPGLRFDQPDIDFNRERAEAYRRALGNPAAIRALR